MFLLLSRFSRSLSSRCGVNNCPGHHRLLPHPPNEAAIEKVYPKAKCCYLFTLNGPRQKATEKYYLLASSESHSGTQRALLMMPCFSTGNLMVDVFMSVVLNSATILLTFRHLSEENQNTAMIPDPQHPSSPFLSITAFYPVVLSAFVSIVPWSN